jgi:hypothetical protein
MVTTVGELNGVGRLLGRVIDEKLEEPEKKRLFERMRFTLGVHVTDMGQSASVTFAGGEATVARGRSGRPDLAVECDNTTFVQFTMFRLGPFGIPIVWDDNGRSVLTKVLRRQLVIRGMIRHLPALYQFLCFAASADGDG